MQIKRQRLQGLFACGFTQRITMRFNYSLKKMLEIEPEVWIAYLYGQKLEELPQLKNKETWLRGRFLLTLAFFFHLIKLALAFRFDFKKSQNSELVFFAGTRNQADALKATIEATKNQKIQISCLAGNGFSSGGEEYAPIGIGLLGVVKVVFLFFSRFSCLNNDLRSCHPAAVKKYFNKFCQVYIYLVVFDGLFKRSKIKFVLTANDHSVQNRCLLLAAKFYGIKTGYLQHASVSRLFPRLSMDYAFLDGQAAHDIYLDCQYNSYVPSCSEASDVKVILSGQKKKLSESSNRKRRYVGVAVNTLDKPSDVQRFVDDLVLSGLTVSLRWHPGQSKHDISCFQQFFSGRDSVLLSDPSQETVSDYLSSLYCIVSGNSSIHLEAALSGVAPVYYEITASDVFDYYGYVDRGLAACPKDFDDLIIYIKESKASDKIDKSAVRYYSSTYQTVSYGKEGELVARKLVELL